MELKDLQKWSKTMEANRDHNSKSNAFAEMLFHFKNVAALFDS